MNSRLSEVKGDPIIAFLAGAFVGLTVGPQIMAVASRSLTARADEIVEAVIDRFLEALGSETATKTGSGRSSTEMQTPTHLGGYYGQAVNPKNPASS